MHLTLSKGKNPFVSVYRHNDGEGGNTIVEAMSCAKGVVVRTRTIEYTGYAESVPTSSVSEALVFIPGAKLKWDDDTSVYSIT